MNWFRDFYSTAVGKKAVMAVTGIILFAYVLVHMLGNMKIYEGPEGLNRYAMFLREFGVPVLPNAGLLWFVRLILLVAVLLHVVATVQLTRMNRRARAQAYARFVPVRTSFASRWMRWSGVLIIVFLIYHLLDLTWGTVHPDFRPHDVYHNVVRSFQVWWVAGFYMAMQIPLGIHLFHGLWSLFQSLGWNHPRFNHWRKAFAVSFAVLVPAGNISFPLAVLAGWIR